MKELQELDCNCNDCAFMVRDIARFKQSEELHNKWQKDYFDGVVARMQSKVNQFYKDQEFEKGFELEKVALKMKYQFDRKECTINYGYCSKFEKTVSFIPMTLQLETQECFMHRKSTVSSQPTDPENKV